MKSPMVLIIVLIFIVFVLLYFCFVLKDKNRRLKRHSIILNSLIDEKQKKINNLSAYCKLYEDKIDFYKSKLEQKNTLDIDRKSNI